MKFKHYFLYIFSLLLLSPELSFGQEDNIDLDNTKISILTCRSGDELYTTFGHTAFRIFNPDTKLDIVYNYGLFSFDTPNFYLKFMRGQLPYYLGAVKMKDFLHEYNYFQRSVFEQELILDNDQKKKIIEFLIDNAKSENRAYEYDFFYDNCATRVVDVYSLAGDVTHDFVVDHKTFRDLLKENLKNLVWSEFGIDLVLGARADFVTNRRGQMFLPEYVKSNLSSAKINSSRQLAKNAHLVLDFEALDVKRKKKATSWPLICTSLLLIITLLLNVLKPKVALYYNKTVLIISGVLGLFLLFMWFGTNHDATRDNWNVMWLNPLFFIFLLGKNKLKYIVAYILIGFLVISAFNCIYTFLPQFFHIAFLPIILSILIIMYSFLKTQKKPKLVVS